MTEMSVRALAELRQELERSTGRCEWFASRLDEIRGKYERRCELERGGWPQPGTEEFGEWRSLLEEVERYYADFAELVRESQQTVESLRQVLGERLSRRLLARIHPASVSATREALAEAARELDEFLAARQAAVKHARAARGAQPWAGRGAWRSAASGQAHAQVVRTHTLILEKPRGEAASEAVGGHAPLEARLVTEAEYSQLTGIARGTLRNWRYQDRREGRDGARPGYPEYRRFGRAVRYRPPDGG